ncbi:MAG: hypothetical protein U1F77_00320 [Kiritimatiellia bacterium]
MGVLRAWCLRNRLPLAVVAGCWLLRLALIALGGQFCWPDEWRYYRGVEWLNRMLHGEFREPLRENLGQAGHVGFILASLLPAAAQGVVRAVTGLHPEDTLALPAAWYALFSAAIPGLVYALMLRSGGDRREAALAMLFAASSTALLHYSRHLFPYDLSMFLWLLALWLGLGPRPSPRTSYACGLLGGAAFTVYNGYWLGAGLALAVHVLWRPGSAAGAARRALAAFAGLVTLPLLIALAGRLAGVSYLDALQTHSGSLIGGRYEEGAVVTWLYLWNNEALFLPLWAAGALLALRVPRARMWVGLAFGVYAVHVLFSLGLHKFVVFGRLARQIILSASPPRDGAGVPAPGRGPAVALLALMAVQTAVNWRPVFTQTFPDDFFHAAEARVGRANLQVGLTVAGPDVRDEPDLLCPALRRRERLPAQARQRRAWPCRPADLLRRRCTSSSSRGTGTTECGPTATSSAIRSTACA